MPPWMCSSSTNNQLSDAGQDTQAAVLKADSNVNADASPTLPQACCKSGHNRGAADGAARSAAALGACVCPSRALLQQPSLPRDLAGPLVDAVGVQAGGRLPRWVQAIQGGPAAPICVTVSLLGWPIRGMGEVCNRPTCSCRCIHLGGGAAASSVLHIPHVHQARLAACQCKLPVSAAAPACTTATRQEAAAWNRKEERKNGLRQRG